MQIKVGSLRKVNFNQDIENKFKNRKIIKDQEEQRKLYQLDLLSDLKRQKETYHKQRLQEIAKVNKMRKKEEFTKISFKNYDSVQHSQSFHNSFRQHDLFQNQSPIDLISQTKINTFNHNQPFLKELDLLNKSTSSNKMDHWNPTKTKPQFFDSFKIYEQYYLNKKEKKIVSNKLFRPTTTTPRLFHDEKPDGFRNYKKQFPIHQMKSKPYFVIEDNQSESFSCDDKKKLIIKCQKPFSPASARCNYFSK